MAQASNLSTASATAIDTLRQQIEAVLTAQGGTWVFVENYVNASNNHYIWRNKGSGVANPNSFGTDFFISISYTTSGPNNLYINAFEGWDATGKLVTRPVPIGNLATNADTSVGGTSGIAYGSPSVSPYAAGRIDVPNAPNTFDSFIIASKNELKVAAKVSNSSNQYAVYAGLFNPWHAQPGEFPLAIVQNANQFQNFTGDVNGYGRSSRHPTRTSVAAATYNHSLGVDAWTLLGGNVGAVDALYGKAEGSRVALIMRGGTSAAGSLPATYGVLRGALYNMACVQVPTLTTVNVGDKLTIDSKEHWFMGFGNTGSAGVAGGGVAASHNWADSTAV